MNGSSIILSCWGVGGAGEAYIKTCQGMNKRLFDSEISFYHLAYRIHSADSVLPVHAVLNARPAIPQQFVVLRPSNTKGYISMGTDL